MQIKITKDLIFRNILAMIIIKQDRIHNKKRNRKRKRNINRYRKRKKNRKYLNRMINKNKFRKMVWHKGNNLYLNNSYNKPIKNMNKLVN